MSFTVQSRPTRLDDPAAPSAAPEALTPEARERSRRRRRVHAIIALLVLVGSSLIVFFGPLGPPLQNPTDEPPALSAPGPLATQDPAESIVAHHVVLRLGWVVVYGDGTVIEYLNSGLMNDRRLTAEGVELIRSGAIHPGALLMQPPAWQPAGTWAVPELTPYVPSRYAACYEWGLSRRSDASEVMGLLPASVQSLLRGRVRTYGEGDIVVPRNVGPAAPVLCSEVGAQEVPVVIAALKDAGFTGDDLTARVDPCVATEQSDQNMVCFKPLLPHGGWHL
ncbi:hypothetical protein [Arthrobacter celericrescens]|uniref:hypothetical protein n=1 Tax=Arthrobacter celericrescens TaxID=2320851 RepID=UPI0013C4E079|nr:hypothetical protein [Arthrobacter celericrescens]